MILIYYITVQAVGSKQLLL